jgi:hypothetical protein
MPDRLGAWAGTLAVRRNHRTWHVSVHSHALNGCRSGILPAGKRQSAGPGTWELEDYAPANSDVNLRSDDLCTLYRSYDRCSTTRPRTRPPSCRSSAGDNLT